MKRAGFQVGQQVQIRSDAGWPGKLSTGTVTRVAGTGMISVLIDDTTTTWLCAGSELEEVE